MTLLQIMADDDAATVLLRTDDLDRIAENLAPFGITLRRWATVPLPADAAQDDVLAAYRSEVDTLSAEGPYPLVDVVRMVPDDTDAGVERARAARLKFLEEHTHDEDEVRFFVEGAGCFYLHLGDKVYAVVCTAGDLMSVPAGTTHWFDMGIRPGFCAIRFFQAEDGWVAGFTGSAIAATMPTLDELLAPAASDLLSLEGERNG
ncbi:acireductone dioxygenase apoprotein [Actinokineospora alba]|uniref:Acireductone dioxygenase n=1 Tax=Actinokineospora alba TaxID=504798 RepID=A0A1H0HBH7_9PSEU|nr:cupin [Actinokineospora alba]TDP64955.1 acireductone dioxygenase apoprotein [Actinokineospora alba]SDH50219.1 1,2-dihydroxy-3-keto-5-methylthiopentene dioxygenase [Actinokineospora alba]SDO16414.1 acireductone dioxygenase apoprotein [Actinokineospora alba]